MTYETQIKELAELCQKDWTDYMSRNYGGLDLNHPNYKITVKFGRKYARVDYGSSGKYMVDLEYGGIFGIKAYGVIHPGHYYGALDTIHDYYWGNYSPRKYIKQLT